MSSKHLIYSGKKMIKKTIKHILKKVIKGLKEDLYSIIGCETEERTASKIYKLLLKSGHPFACYKICLISESFRIGHEKRRIKTIRARLVYSIKTPAISQLTAFLKAECMQIINQVKRWTITNSIHIIPKLSKKLRLSKARVSNNVSVANIFVGLSYRAISSTQRTYEFIQANGRYENSYSNQVNRESSDYLKRLISMPSSDNTSNQESRVGVLISCFHPEKYIDGFLENLCSLSGKDRIVPIFINAGMSLATEKLIKEKISSAYPEYHFITKIGCKIYEAWNIGIYTAKDSVDYFTNFNVDDRRHPNCLQIQYTYLDKFKRANIAVTDYIYFFKFLKTIEELYDANDGNQTNIPVINDRTLLFTNYPHSSPMWRKSLHDDPKIGYFDESYISAGDAEFWYRVSRLYPNGFDTISIPLSLYYQNPEGLSTRPNTYGAIEHTKCSKEHYENLIEKIEKNVDTTFSKNYLKHCDINNLSIFAAKSYLDLS